MNKDMQGKLEELKEWTEEREVRVRTVIGGILTQGQEREGGGGMGRGRGRRRSCRKSEVKG